MRRNRARLAAGVAAIWLVALIFSYGRLIRTVETAATAAGYVDGTQPAA